jgi:hypothetical protein
VGAKETFMRNVLRISMLAALALGALAVDAQAQAKPKSFGIVAGVDFATWNGSGSDGGYLDIGGTGFTVNKGSSTGFLGGFYADIPLSTSIAFEPELLYEGKGVAYDVTAAGFAGSGTVDIGLDYIAVPLLFRYNFQASGGPYALVGPSVGFNIACNLDVSGSGDFTGGSSAKCDDPTIGLSATSVTFGGVVGLGFQRGKVGLEGRYDWDFSDAFEAVNGVNSDVNNAAWEILLRYQFK